MNCDRELVEAVRSGAPGAFERLVREHQALCWHVIQRLVRDAEDTRDLCQETFLRVHRNLHQYRYESALRTWIGRLAYSIALRHLERRRGAAIVEADPDGEAQRAAEAGEAFDLEAACADRETMARLHAAIEQLPPLPRMLLTLYHLDELTLAEIADITGLALGTIKSHLFRSRARLRALLEPDGGSA